MADEIHGWAAPEAGGRLEPFSFEPDPLGHDDVEIAVESCGICHSDLSMLDNEWGRTTYPFVGGHEAVGVVTDKGPRVTSLDVGERIGVGWFAGSCMRCANCLDGDHQMCVDADETIVGRHGAFADRLRAHWSWAIPLPSGLDPATAGPLFCGGATVFGPIAEHVRPTDRVGVVGIGGLGHLALQFLDKWGCEVTAFTSTDAKADEAMQLGADRVVNSRDDTALKAERGRFDMVLVTVNVPLNWGRYLSALGPRGRMHIVGAILEPIPVSAFALMGESTSIGGSGLASPATIRRMLEFCVRHDIAPRVETFPMSDVNAAFDHLRAGDARYRIVLSA